MSISQTTFNSENFISENSTTKEIRSLLKVNDISAVEPNSEEYEMLFNKSIYFWVTLQYAWELNINGFLECKVQFTWNPKYFDNNKIQLYTSESNNAFSWAFELDNTGGFYCKDRTISDEWTYYQTNNGTGIFNNSCGTPDENKNYGIIFTSDDIELSKFQPSFSFHYSYTDDNNITYYVNIPEVKIPKPTKYSNNFVFNNVGLNDFINQIHEYPKHFLHISDSMKIQNTDPEPFGTLPVIIHDEKYCIPIIGLTGSSGDGDNTTPLVHITSEYAMYDSNEEGKKNPQTFEEKYVQKKDQVEIGITYWSDN